MVPEQRFFSGDVPQDEGAFGGVLPVRVARRACGDPGQQDVGGCAEQGDVVELGVELPLVRRRPQEPGRGRDAGKSRADVLTADAPGQAWKRRSCGNGSKGPRMYDWAAATLPEDGTEPPGWQRFLLVRRSLTPNAKGELELAYYLCAAPAGTTDEELIRVAGARWAVEECFQAAKNEAGLDHYQVRRYDAWYRHATLAVLAHAYLAVTAANAPKALAAASSRSRSRRSAVYWHT
jgi:hypothetical protein